MIKKDKHGWVEIVEAFVAIMLVAGVLLILINRGYIGKTDLSEEVYTTELSILREIQTDDNFREQILSISSLPALVPNEIKQRIKERTPGHLNCTGQICDLVECQIGTMLCKDEDGDKYCYEENCPDSKDINTEITTCSPPISTQCLDKNGENYCYKGTCLTSSTINTNPSASKCEYIGELPKKDIYAQEVTITATLTTLEYRKLKLFCWTR